MLSSMYSGVSGLKVHQTKLDVIGNNIANVNTTAFKGSRVSFKDVFSQTLIAAQPSSSKTGGINPSQVGLGTSVGSIATIQKNGNLQNTDNPDDFAIEGEGLFIVSDGINTRYTRAGNFTIDGEGNLATASGELVLGWNKSGSSVNTSRSLKPINVAGLTMSASATDKLVFTGNIDSDTELYDPGAQPVGEVGNFAVKTKSKPETLGEWTFKLTDALVNGDSNISIGGNTIEVGAGKTIDSTSISSVSDQIDAIINALTTASSDYGKSPGQHYIVSKEDTDTIVITEDAGKANGNSVSLTGGVPSGSSSSRFENEEVTKSKAGTKGVYSFDITKNFEAGDIIQIGDKSYTAVASGATAGAGEFVIGATATNTATNLVSVINNDGIYSASNGTTASSKITLTEKVPSGEDIDRYDVAMVVPDDNAVTRSISIFDSLGEEHLITLKIMKTDNNEYDYEVTTDDREIKSLSSGKGKLVFNGDGTLDTKNTVKKSIKINFSNGARSIDISTNDIVFDADKLTQNSNDTDIDYVKDGYNAGTIDNITIDKEGKIMGTFSNGMKQHQGTIALATFTNTAGLEKVGNNLYASTLNSGEAQVGTPATDERGKIRSNSLEMSNVDLSKEFTEMIVAQRGFQANSRIITTSDELLQELVNLKR